MPKVRKRSEAAKRRLRRESNDGLRRGETPEDRAVRLASQAQAMRSARSQASSPEQARLRQMDSVARRSARS